MKLNLGCGIDYRKEYINIDNSELVKIDILKDLEDAYLPFCCDVIDEVLANHVFEHVNNFIPLMHEIHRVCKNNAVIKIRVPFYSTWGQYNDPTHKRFFSPFTFNYFTKNNYSHEVGAMKDMFKVEIVKLNFGIGFSRKLNFLFNPIINLNHKIYCRFFAWVFPVAEIYFKLRVMK